MDRISDHVIDCSCFQTCITYSMCYRSFFFFSCPGLVYQLCDSLHARVQVTTADGWIQVIANWCRGKFTSIYNAVHECIDSRDWFKCPLHGSE